LSEQRLVPVTLEGEVVRLEPLADHHFDGLCAAGLEPSLWDIQITRVRTPDDMRAYMDAAFAQQRDGTALPFATVLRATGEVIGSTRFANAVHEHRRVEIGWTWITPRHQRTRVNTEAKFLMLRHAFESMAMRRVELKTNALNARSRAAMLRIGCTEEGTLRQHMLNSDGSSRDSVYFSILDSEWPAVRQRLTTFLTRR
jgi:RimJ/RimL family protein N-acetyltransferase